MDQQRFDRIARLLGSATTRRTVLGAAAAALGAGSGAARARPRPEGPCGDGSRAANRCASDKECCTGICNRKAGKTNRDGAGRCRCLKRGTRCGEDRSCCGALVCLDGRCGPVPETCDVCASGCAHDSVASAVAAAPAGAEIAIAPGTWIVPSLAITRSLTLRACNKASGVILQEDPATTASMLAVESPADDVHLVVRGLTLQRIKNQSFPMVRTIGGGAGKVALTLRETRITGIADPNSIYAVNVYKADGVVMSSSIQTFGSGIRVDYGSLRVTGSTFTNLSRALVIRYGAQASVSGCTFEDIFSNAISFYGPASGLTLMDSTFRTVGDIDFTQGGMLGAELDGVITIGGTIDVNGTLASYGGAIALSAIGVNVPGATGQVTILGDGVRIENGFASSAVGAVVVFDDGTYAQSTLTGFEQITIVNTTPDPVCAIVDGSLVVTPAPNCAF